MYARSMRAAYRVVQSTTRRRNGIGVSVRTFSTVHARLNSNKKPILSYIPHAFPIEEAAGRFTQADERRLFAPSVSKNSSALASTSNPLKKIFAPIFGINVSITHVHYSGQYAIDRTETTTNDKGESTTRTYTDWYDTSGTLEPQEYNQEDRNMSIYAGFTWHRNTIEHALQGYPITRSLQPFDIKDCDADIFVDPFMLRGALAYSMAIERIKSAESSRAEQDIRRRISCDGARVYSSNISIVYERDEEDLDKFYLNKYLLPAYVLQYDDTPARVLSAISQKDYYVYGAAPLSVPKVTAAGAITSSLLAFALREIIPPEFQFLLVLGSTIASAFWAHSGLSIRYTMQQGGIEASKNDNEKVSESLADKERFEATARDFKTIIDSKPILDLDPSFYTVMGLDPSKPVDEEMVQAAFVKKIKEAHPDQQTGNTQQTRELLEARQRFFTALGKKPPINSSSRREFSTYAPVRLKEPPTSVAHHNAGLLIRTVLEEKNYKKAEVLVKEERAFVDSHDKNENTLLTEAAKKGDRKAVCFAIDTLKASVDTSCDCPCHYTALHYAAEGGKHDIMEDLLKRKANPNLISYPRGYTAMDLAYLAKDQKAMQILEKHGGVRHRTLEGNNLSWSRRLFGFKPSERGILNSGEKPNVIQLPSSSQPKP